MKYGIIVFPGSNCDYDAYYATRFNSGADNIFIWHKETSLPKGLDCIILPGGFSYGDYLRCGAIARFSPIMKDVIKFGENGGFVLGICNGFQILTEAGLLPGALLNNQSLHFVCRDTYLYTINNSVSFSSSLQVGDILKIPVAHGEGNYFADEDVIKELEEENRIIFKYCDPDGNIIEKANPNGSLNNIAGIINKKGNVLGMMPHPERACDGLMGSSDGLKIFNSLNNYFN